MEFRIKPSPGHANHHSYRSVDEDSTHPDDLLDAQFEAFGTTPPRTRMKNKNRDWNRSQKSNAITVTAG